MTFHQALEAMLHSSTFGENEIDRLLKTSHRRRSRRMTPLRRPPASLGLVASPVGPLLAAVSARGIALLQYFDHPADDLPDRLDRLRYNFDLIPRDDAIELVAAEIGRFFGGDPDALRYDVDLTLVDQEFHRRAFARLRKVPRGAVISYQGLADAIGAPNAQRAVGNAMNRNPIALYIPCHRVIRSDETLGNYGGGVGYKLELLRAEGFSFDASHRLPPSTLLGHRQTRIFCRQTCYTAARVNRSRVLYFAAAEHASRAGLRPCKVCKPVTEVARSA